MRKQIRIKQVDAFTTIPLSGNPAGVVTNADELDDVYMQRIAREMNLSETAFVQNSGVADFRLRFFTPKCEIDLCGHATIGAIYALIEEGRIPLRSDHTLVHQETKAGILPIEIYSNNNIVQNIMMTQAIPQFKDLGVDNREISDILKWLKYNPDGMRKIGLKARETVAKRTWDDYSKDIYKLYKEVEKC